MLLAILTIPTAEALDEAEAWDYIRARPHDAVQDILRLNVLETTVPVAGEVVLSVQIVGRDVYVIPAGPVEVVHGHISYTLTIDEAVARDVIPPPRRIGPWVTGALFAGVLAGVVGSALLF